MTVFEFLVTYAVCWWMVLFMVLPHQANASAKPEVGHAPSAPETPQLGKKFRWATLLAFIPAIALYFVVHAAHAEENMYHAGGGCTPLEVHSASADVEAKDGFSTGGEKVKPATLGGSSILGDKDRFDIPLRIPSQNYINASNYNADMSQSFIGVGDISVSKDGKTTLNGKPVGGQATYPDGCAPLKDEAPSVKPSSLSN